MPRPIKSLELQGLSFNRNSKFYEFFKSYTSKASVACERHNCSTTARNCSDSDVCMVGVHEPPPPPPHHPPSTNTTTTPLPPLKDL